MSTGTVWNYRDFIKREHGAEEAIEFEIAVKKYQAEQIAYERERIIKLLESDEWHDIAFATRSPDEQPTKYHDGECLGCRQIALIKGEQK